jgi:hypothetical protein
LVLIGLRTSLTRIVSDIFCYLLPDYLTSPAN